MRLLLQVIKDPVEEEVCYRYDMYESCMEILHDRARLYRKVYHHRRALALPGDLASVVGY